MATLALVCLYASFCSYQGLLACSVLQVHGINVLWGLKIVVLANQFQAGMGCGIGKMQSAVEKSIR